MSNKIKSLLYLSCFILAAIFYHQTINTVAKEELVTNTIHQEVDNVIDSYAGNTDNIETN